MAHPKETRVTVALLKHFLDTRSGAAIVAAFLFKPCELFPLLNFRESEPPSALNCPLSGMNTFQGGRGALSTSSNAYQDG